MIVKRALSIALTAMMLFSALGMMVSAAEIDSIEQNVSNNDWSSSTWSAESTFESSHKVTSATVTNGHGGKFNANISGVVESQGRYTNTIEGIWHMEWDTLKTNDVYTSSIVCTLDSGADPKTVIIPCTLTITNDPVIRLNEDSVRKLFFDGLQVGKSYSMTALAADRDNLLPPGYKIDWRVTRGAEFASFSNIKTDAAKMSGTADLKINAAGNFEIRTYLLNANGEEIESMGYPVDDIDAPDLVPVPDEKMDQAAQNLQGNKDASIDVLLNEGITADQFEMLKNASTGRGKVDLTFNGNEELTLSFDPSRIDSGWSGDFTPSFTASVPENARELGYHSRHGKWLHFFYSGKLPAPMTVTLKVAPGTFPEGTTELKVWYYNEDQERLVEQELVVAYDAQASTVRFTLGRFSAYAVFPDGTDPNEGIHPRPGNGGGSNSDEVREKREANLAAIASSANDLNALPKREVTIDGQKVTASILSLNAEKTPFVYYHVIDRLAGRSDVVLEITVDEKTTLVSASKLKKSAANRVFFTLPDLAKLA